MCADKTSNYEYICLYLLPTIMNIHWGFKDNRCLVEELHKAADYTDEAFAILTLENNYKIWLYEYNKKVVNGETTTMGSQYCCNLVTDESIVHPSAEPDVATVESPAKESSTSMETDGGRPDLLYTRIGGEEDKARQQ